MAAFPSLSVLNVWIFFCHFCLFTCLHNGSLPNQQRPPWPLTSPHIAMATGRPFRYEQCDLAQGAKLRMERQLRCRTSPAKTEDVFCSVLWQIVHDSGVKCRFEIITTCILISLKTCLTHSQFGFLLRLHLCLLFTVPPLRCHVHLSEAVHPVPISARVTDDAAQWQVPTIMDMRVWTRHDLGEEKQIYFSDNFIVRSFTSVQGPGGDFQDLW